VRPDACPCARPGATWSAAGAWDLYEGERRDVFLCSGCGSHRCFGPCRCGSEDCEHDNDESDDPVTYERIDPLADTDRPADVPADQIPY
jgi:hypothetical protein